MLRISSERALCVSQVCSSGPAAGQFGREKPVHPLAVSDRRRHGHEHAVKGACDEPVYIIIYLQCFVAAGDVTYSFAYL